MAVLRSRLDPASEDSRANHNAMAALVADLKARDLEELKATTVIVER